MIEMNKMVEQLDFEESAAGVLLSDTISGGRMKNVIEHLETTSIEIEKMAQNLNSIIGGINEGNGAINYLTRDSVFVNQLERSIENIEQGTERFNENMEALKHNFLTRGYFRKLEKKEKKNSN